MDFSTPLKMTNFDVFQTAFLFTLSLTQSVDNHQNFDHNQ